MAFTTDVTGIQVAWLCHIHDSDEFTFGQRGFAYKIISPACDGSVSLHSTIVETPGVDGGKFGYRYPAISATSPALGRRTKGSEISVLLDVFVAEADGIVIPAMRNLLYREEVAIPGGAT